MSTYSYEGMEREYTLYRPSNLKENSPLVVFLHWYTGSAKEIIDIINENLDNDKSGIIDKIDKNNSIFIDKTRLLLNETITRDINEYNKNITHLVENNNNALIDKTKLLMGENQDKYISQVNLTLQQFHSNLSDEINNLVKKIAL